MEYAKDKTMLTGEEENPQVSVGTMSPATALHALSSGSQPLSIVGRAEAVEELVRFRADCSGTSDASQALAINDVVASVASVSISSPLPATTTTPASIKLQAFPLFSSLPVELRFKVWRRALPLFPRIIRIGGPCASGVLKFQIKDGSALLEYVGVKCNTVAVLLSVSREARSELLKHYTSPFAADNLTHLARRQDNNVERSVRHLRVNLDIDVLFIAEFRGMSRLALHPLAQLFRGLFGDDEERIRKGIRFLAASKSVWHDLELVEKLTDLSAYPGVIPTTTTITTTGHHHHHHHHRQLRASYKVLHEFGPLKQIFVVTEKMKERYSFMGFKDVNNVVDDHAGTTGAAAGAGGVSSVDTEAESYKANLEKRLEEMDRGTGRGECVVKVVQLQQKYLAHQGLLANMQAQAAALRAERNRF